MAPFLIVPYFLSPWSFGKQWLQGQKHDEGCVTMQEAPHIPLKENFFFYKKLKVKKSLLSYFLLNDGHGSYWGNDAPVLDCHHHAAISVSDECIEAFIFSPFMDATYDERNSLMFSVAYISVVLTNL